MALHVPPRRVAGVCLHEGPAPARIPHPDAHRPEPVRERRGVDVIERWWLVDGLAIVPSSVVPRWPLSTIVGTRLNFTPPTLDPNTNTPASSIAIAYPMPYIRISCPQLHIRCPTSASLTPPPLDPNTAQARGVHVAGGGLPHVPGQAGKHGRPRGKRNKLINYVLSFTGVVSCMQEADVGGSGKGVWWWCGWMLASLQSIQTTRISLNF